MIVRAARILGLAITLLCWYSAINARWSGAWTLIMIWCTPLLQYPISILGRHFLDAAPTRARSEKADIFVHYAMMISLGVSIFPAIRFVQQHPHGRIPIPEQVGYALTVLTSIATLATVLNLAIRALGAPFAAKLSSRLAVDWMYAWTRNPMVLCTLALLLSIGLMHRSVWVVLWVLASVSPGLMFFVWRYEERELEIRFGQAYLEYRLRTPRFWPRKPLSADRHPAQANRAGN